VADPRALLVGRVIWDEGSDWLFSKEPDIKVYVNGVRQWPGKLGRVAKGQRQRQFEAQILLTRRKGNQIEVELPADFKQDADNKPVCWVDCRKPGTPPQRLYLLPINLGNRNQKEFLGHVFQVIHARAINWSRKQFQTDRFFEGRFYDQLTRGVRWTQLPALLDDIQDEIRARKEEDFRSKKEVPVDVLMVYFSSPFSLEDKELVFQDIEGDRKDAADLMKQFGGVLGAQVVFMNLASSRRLALENKEWRPLANWSDVSRASLFGYTWLDPNAPAGKQKEDAFTQALAAAFRSGSRLKDVAKEFETLSKKLSRKYPTLLISPPYCPPLLADFPVGKLTKG
jgi:hypothetical protein